MTDEPVLVPIKILARHELRGCDPVDALWLETQTGIPARVWMILGAASDVTGDEPVRFYIET